MPDNRLILLRKIAKATRIYNNTYLQTLDTIDLLNLWLKLSRPYHKTRKTNNIKLEAVTA
jgi:hypothetical protein